MFGLKERIASVLTTGGIAAILGVFAILGIVWLTVALYTVLTAYMSTAGAMTLVGILCLAPLVVWLMTRRKAERAPVEEMTPMPDLTGLPIERLVESIDTISRTSPIGGVGLAFGAAWIASRTPNATALSSMLAAEAVERLLRLIADFSAAHAPPAAGPETPPETPRETPVSP